MENDTARLALRHHADSSLRRHADAGVDANCVVNGFSSRIDLQFRAGIVENHNDKPSVADARKASFLVDWINSGGAAEGLQQILSDQTDGASGKC